MAITRNKIINKITTLDGVEHEIVPTKLTDNSTNYSVSLDTLTADDKIALKSNLKNYSAGTNIQISSSNVISATDNDTKNTAGSSNTSSKLYLIGATSQSSNPVTYSNSSLYATNGSLCCLSIYNPNGTSTSGSGNVGTSSNYWSGVYTDYLYILSDERLKNKIKKIDSSKFNRVILNTPVYNFTFKNDINKIPKIGIMAQDLERELAEDYIYFGDIVDDSEKSGLKDKHQLKENKLIYLLWGALQEQQEEINILKTKISKLED